MRHPDDSIRPEMPLTYFFPTSSLMISEVCKNILHLDKKITLLSPLQYYTLILDSIEDTRGIVTKSDS